MNTAPITDKPASLPEGGTPALVKAQSCPHCGNRVLDKQPNGELLCLECYWCEDSPKAMSAQACQPATPLPWHATCERTGRITDHVIHMGKCSMYFTRGVGQTEEDARKNAAYIVAACNAMPALVEALRGLLAYVPEERLGTGTFERKAYSARNTARDNALAALDSIAG